jgi:beta-glucosidase
LPSIFDYNIRNGRTYMYDRNEPSFAFGHGLSHTKFEFKSLKLDRPEIKDGET